MAVGLTGSGKLHQQFGQRGGEQQRLSGLREPPDDFLKLVGETHFKQPARGSSIVMVTHTDSSDV